MLIYEKSEYEICWLQSDGTFTYSVLKAEWDASLFRDYGSYLIPESFFDEFYS